MIATRRMKFLLLLLLFLLAPAVAAAETAKVERRTFVSQGRQRTYYLYVPASLSASAPAPLLVTLHGSNMDGRGLVNKWKGLAAKEGFVVVGPDAHDAAGWSVPGDGPEFLRDLVEEVKSACPVDARRVYVFGWSAGANFALQMTLYESEYFAAASIYAGALIHSRYQMLDHATRKIPLAITVGTDDPLYPAIEVRATRDALKSHGFPVQLRELLGRDHDYYADADEINRVSWAFMRGYRLEAEPRFRPLHEESGARRTAPGARGLSLSARALTLRANQRRSKV
jgi:poly(3-hydroxybutyrate) depolymerase